ncbi:TPA: hypothetical protein R4S87_001856 [Kluyvera cryocrescens]|nr:hypothetical protein [Kluyvera cryocrescens]
MKTPTYAVIKVDSAGIAKITKRWANECEDVAEIHCTTWRNERRNARLGGLRYFRLQCLSTEGDIWWINPKHAASNGAAFHINEFFSCRCCFPEWLLADSDIAKAIEEISKRKHHK